MAHLQIALLGTFTANIGGHSLISAHIHHNETQCLLAFLVLESERAHSHDALAPLLWPDEPHFVAKRNLRECLVGLRQTFESTAAKTGNAEPHLLITQTAVQFNAASEYTCDIAQFAHCIAHGDLEHALGLYRGDLLASLRNDSLPFNEWLALARGRFHELAIWALGTLIKRAKAMKNFAAKRQLAQREATLRFWHVQPHHDFLHRLIDEGSHQHVMRLCENCCAVLAELGLTPTPELVALIEQIRGQLNKPQPATGVGTATAALWAPWQHPAWRANTTMPVGR
jgi:DNA-binding SARP family transcriptional activator